MGIYNIGSTITAIKHMGTEINAVYHMGVKVWPDGPVEEFSITHDKQSNFSIAITCTTYSTVTINWGDGSSVVVDSGAQRTHTYATAKDWKVTITGNLANITGITSQSQQIKIVKLHSIMSNVLSILLNGNKFSSIDLNMCSKIANLYLYSNTTLTQVIMPSSVTNASTARSFFIFSTSISSFTIPDEIITVEYFYCYNCLNLTSLNFPSSLRTLTFFHCYSSGVTSIYIPNLTYITELQGYSCSNLTSVTIGGSVLYLNNFWLYYCPILSSLTISSLKTCSSYVMQGTSLATHVFSQLTSASILNFRRCGLSQAQIDDYLSQALAISNVDTDFSIFLDNTGTIGSANSVPSALGLSIKSTLQSKGISVTTP